MGFMFFLLTVTVIWGIDKDAPAWVRLLSLYFVIAFVFELFLQVTNY